MLEANRLILDDLEERIEGELVDSRVEGRVVIEAGARARALDRARPRDHRRAARAIMDAYIGPYTAIGEDVTIEQAEIEHSIVLVGLVDPRPRGPRRGQPDRDATWRSPQPRAAEAPTASWSATTRRSRSCEGARDRRGRDARPGRVRGVRRPRRGRAHARRPRRDRRAARPGRRRERRAPTWCVNCAAYTDVDGAEERRGRGAARERRRGGHVAARRAPARSYVPLDRLRVRRREGRALRRVRPHRPRVALRPLQARRRAGHRRRPTRATSSSAPPGCSASGGKNFVDTMLRVGARAGRGARGRADQVGCPTYTGHLAEALVRLAATRGARHPPRRRRRIVLVVRAAPRPRSSAPGSTCRVSPMHHRRVPAAGSPRPPTPCSARARDADPPARLAGRPRRLPRRAGGARHEAARHRRRRVHRLDLRARSSAGEHDVVVLDKLTYAGRRENLPEDVTASWRARSRTPASCAR